MASTEPENAFQNLGAGAPAPVSQATGVAGATLLAFLLAQLAWPNPALALRIQAGLESSAEEALKSGLEERLQTRPMDLEADLAGLLAIQRTGYSIAGKQRLWDRPEFEQPSVKILVAEQVSQSVSQSSGWVPRLSPGDRLSRF